MRSNTSFSTPSAMCRSRSSWRLKSNGFPGASKNARQEPSSIWRKVWSARTDLDIADHVPSARRRVLGPGHAGVEPRDAGGERLLGLVEDRQLVLMADIVLDVAIGIEDRDRLARLGVAVAAAGHPIADIV